LLFERRLFRVVQSRYPELVTVPREKITARLHANVDGILSTAAKKEREFFSSEIYSPFLSAGKSGDASPFIKSLFPEIRLAAIIERSLNTALGWGWDKIAADIAEATYGNAVVGYHVNGQIPATTATQINNITAAYTGGAGHAVPDTAAELAAIIPGVGAPGAKEDVREKDDVFYVDENGHENHIEIKTPKPNYDQARAAKRRILRIHAVRHPTSVSAIVGMAYNPNGLYGEYAWPTTKYFIDFSTDLKVGRDFWNYVGGATNTYENLLDCFLEVSHARRDELRDLLKKV
jgi:hypothetical protein